ncbi:MAG: hypothetical protein EXR46_03280 [Dehalococcoidia bacterium]|nr:hypothetical protein [Dehalococcoidia bacterium]
MCGKGGEAIEAWRHTHPDVALDLREQDVLFLVRLDNFVFDGWQHPRKYEHSLNTLLHALDGKTWPATE